VVTVENEAESARGGQGARQPFFVRRYFDSYIAEMAAFVESILRDEQPLVTDADGWTALRLAQACRRSWLSGQPIDVSGEA
jgi:myo-inositol 2-dehydrogenase/D-chiro-inositol 1-dehydrogenase